MLQHHDPASKPLVHPESRAGSRGSSVEAGTASAAEQYSAEPRPTTLEHDHLRSRLVLVVRDGFVPTRL